MKTSVATAAAVSSLIAISILAVPAVASGAEYLSDVRATDTTTAAGLAAASRLNDLPDATAPNSSGDAAALSPLITVWGISGLALLAGGSIAVAASVRKQRRLAA